MPLTEQQTAALPVLDWLIGGERRTGRSLVIAVAIIRAACRNPGVSFYLVDHFNSTQQTRCFTRNCINSLLHHSPLPEYARFSLNQERLIVHTPRSFEWELNLNWGTPPPVLPFSEDTLVHEMPHSLASDRILTTEYPQTTPPPKPALQRIFED